MTTSSPSLFRKSWLRLRIKNNGVIIIWWDETEGGDDASRAIPEFVISPLAKGNGLRQLSGVQPFFRPQNDGRNFRSPNVNNPIPASETNNFGGFNNVATVNDLSDLFVPGAIPARQARR